MEAKPARLGDIEQAAAAAVAAEFEGEIREFVRRDISVWRRPRVDVAVDGNSGNIDSAIERVSQASVEEIDMMIAELQTLRATLVAEGERIRREITNYAGLSQSAMTSLKIMADSLSQFSNTAKGEPAADDALHETPRHSAG